MSSDQFNMVLPSNSSLDIFPSNSLASYITKLSQPLNLEGQWEVGLGEIQFEKSWYNVREKENLIFYFPASGKPFHVVKIPIGYYPTIEELISIIHQELQKADPNFLHYTKFTFDKISNRVQVEVKSGATISFSDDIATIFGFQTPFDTALKTTTTAPFSVNIQLGIYSLYVYTDLAEAQTVGDTRVPLLRIVPSQGQHGEFITRTYERLQYVPVAKSLIDTIRIDIRDDTGELIQFQSGKVVITLHLRLASSPHFN